MEKFKKLPKKLQWLGINIDGKTYIFCDNENAVKSTSRTEITLSKKYQIISWHSGREAISAGEMSVFKDP